MRYAALHRVDLNLLLALSELAATGSVTLAAARLGITQSAMSRTLGRLRTTFGDPLFLRGASGLRPTPRAEALLPAVDAWLEQADVLIGGAPRFDPLTAERTFVVSAADYGEAVLLPELLRRLEREAPKVKLRISTQPLPLDAALEKGELDLAWTPKQPSARTVVWTRLFDETFTFVVRKGHPVTKRPFTLDRFCALRHLALAPVGRSNSNPIDELLARLGRKREVVATVPSFLVVPSLLLTSDVGVILPRRIFHAAAQRFGLVSLALPFQSHGFTLHHAWHERMRKDAGHAWFRQVVVEVSKTV
jgi:DNA-binding transcriptional LysR family regulator